MTQTITQSTTSASRPRSAERFAALSGLAFVVLLVVHASLLADGVPSMRASAETITGYLSDKKAEIQIGTYLQGLALVAFAWFLGSVWRHLRSAERGPGRLSVVVVASVASLMAMIGIHISMLTALALRTDHGLEPQLASTMWVFAFVVLGMSAFPTAALLAAVGVLALRTGTLPRWFAWFSLVGGALWLVSGVGATTDADTWGILGVVAFLLWLAWTAIASVLIVRRAQ